MITVGCYDVNHLLARSIKSTPLPLTLTDEETQQRTEWKCLLRRLVSDLREKRFTVPGLKKAIEEGMQLRSEETRDCSASMAGAKRCLLSLDTLRKRTGKLMATERQALEITDDIAEAADDPGGSAPVSILFDHFGEDASAGHLSAKPSRSGGADGAAGPAESWRMGHPSSSDEDDEPSSELGQRR